MRDVQSLKITPVGLGVARPAENSSMARAGVVFIISKIARLRVIWIIIVLISLLTPNAIQ